MAARIVSLIASSTEIVCALGLEKELVGISHECDYPSSVKKLPVCTTPKFQTDGSSYDIDQRVKAILEQAVSVYQVNADLVASLQPTHIITQAQCEVCAVSLKDVEEAACALMPSKPQIISLEPNSLPDVFADIRRVGSALSISERAETLIDSLGKSMKDVADAAQIKVREFKRRPRVAFIEWIDPLMCGGNWMPKLIRMAGGDNLFGEDGKHSPPLDWGFLKAADPEVLIIAPCGFDIKRTQKEINLLAGRDGWKQLSCVKQGRVFIADGNQFFNRPGPRILETLEILYQTIWGSLHLPPDPSVKKKGPATDSTGRVIDHQGTGWINLK